MHLKDPIVFVQLAVPLIQLWIPLAHSSISYESEKFLEVRNLLCNMTCQFTLMHILVETTLLKSKAKSVKSNAWNHFRNNYSCRHSHCTCESNSVQMHYFHVFITSINNIITNTDASWLPTSYAHVTGHQSNLARFDGIKPIVTADRNGSFARFDFLTGCSRNLLNGTQRNCKLANKKQIFRHEKEINFPWDIEMLKRKFSLRKSVKKSHRRLSCWLRWNFFV